MKNFRDSLILGLSIEKADEKIREQSVRLPSSLSRQERKEWIKRKLKENKKTGN